MKRFFYFISYTIILILVSCSWQAEETKEATQDFLGIVVADEPYTIQVASDILKAGGTAADAAAAAYFTMTVTMPSSVGLGGGGICLVHYAAKPKDKKPARTESINFLPYTLNEQANLGQPGAIRGMAALHARYGDLKWQEVVIPAENLARKGFKVSRALAREILTADNYLRQDPATSAVFTKVDGTLLDEGSMLVQPALADVLGGLRARGANDFYIGLLAKQIGEAAQASNIPITSELLASVKPNFVDTIKLELGRNMVHFASPPAANGLFEAQFLLMLQSGHGFLTSGLYQGAREDEKPHIFVELLKRAYVEESRWLNQNGDITAPSIEKLLDEDYIDNLVEGISHTKMTPLSSLTDQPINQDQNPWAAGFVIADAEGMAIACNFTMNALFGNGHVIPGLGILWSSAAGKNGDGYNALGPALVVNGYSGAFHYGTSASGGATAASSLIYVLMQTNVLDKKLNQVIGNPRLHYSTVGDVVLYEENEKESVLESLKQHGHNLDQGGIVGRVNAIWCPEGLPGKEQSCEVASDPRGNGLGVIVVD
ncbi:MAG: gamma-glutamyltransferase family protein [Alphaproteobacteria bacterium]|nr:gamma-glutamyltransferase family protein [Alphaproteobacteria bacterium]